MLTRNRVPLHPLFNLLDLHKMKLIHFFQLTLQKFMKFVVILKTYHIDRVVPGGVCLKNGRDVIFEKGLEFHFVGWVEKIP